MYEVLQSKMLCFIGGKGRFRSNQDRLLEGVEGV